MYSKLLLEDNKNIESLIQHLESLIVNIRTSGKLKNDFKLLKYIQSFYENYPMYFYENYIMKDIEINSELEQEIINEILDFINKLEKF
jgi:hypothetical protein